jgi:hypothetical protein
LSNTNSGGKARTTISGVKRDVNGYLRALAYQHVTIDGVATDDLNLNGEGKHQQYQQPTNCEPRRRTLLSHSELIPKPIPILSNYSCCGCGAGFTGPVWISETNKQKKTSRTFHGVCNCKREELESNSRLRENSIT